MSIDNGVLSFTDVSHSDWPVVLITNPKNSKFIAPKVEKIESFRKLRKAFTQKVAHGNLESSVPKGAHSFALHQLLLEGLPLLLLRLTLLLL